MIRNLILVCVALVVNVLDGVAAEDHVSSLNSVVQAEKDFARRAAEKGIRDAFLAFLAEDSVVFRPGPISGRKCYEERPPAKGLLAWYPSVADVASSADLGYTTGPWEFRSEPGKPAPDATGIYFTVWKKQQDGTWKAALDIGVRTETAQELPAIDSAVSPTHPKDSSPVAKSTPSQEVLFAADRDFLACATAKGADQAYAELGAPGLVLIRESAGLLKGRDAVEASKQPLTMRGEPMGGIVSAAGDLGYTYGSCEYRAAASEGAPAKGHYMRVWRRSVEGRWTVAVDMLCPLPPPPPSSPQ